MTTLISVIIPTLNEQRYILRLIGILKDIESLEIIVADGGSNDKTCEIIKDHCRVIHTERGRATQMNAGVREANGEILWFLHADSVIAANMADEIRSALSDEFVAGGGFRLRFDDSSPILKLIAMGSNWRAKLLKLFFGDQGFFIRRSIFGQIGGFPPVALMEDWMLSQKAKQTGRLVLLSGSITTSSRRFRKRGIVRTFLLMQWIKLLFLCGVPTSTLERMYRRG